jgi:hypothetical protein
MYNLHSSPDIIRMISSRNMRWVEHVPHWRGVKYVLELAENLKGKEQLEKEA